MIPRYYARLLGLQRMGTHQNVLHVQHMKRIMQHFICSDLFYLSASKGYERQQSVCLSGI